jgi:Kelch motif
MTQGRAGAAAASLPNGQVLVAGGVEYGGPADCGGCMYPPQIVDTLQTAEIFNPAKGFFSRTGSMTVPRSGAIAAPLPGGRVLVAGGFNGSNYLTTAEVFDPATHSFSPTGSMNVARAGAAAAPLPNGRVLVAGDQNYDGSNYVSLDSAEIFDPDTGTFSLTNSRMTIPRFGAAAAPLPNGRVLVAGDVYFPFQNTAEVFDPATGSFSPTGSMTYSGGIAAPLPDGRVLVAGGRVADRSAEIFDPSRGSFASFPLATLDGRANGVAASLSDGRVLLAGGSFPIGGHADNAVRQGAELFTPGLSRRIRRGTVIVDTSVAGTVTVVEKGARKRLLKRTSASGGPGKITVKLRPTAKAERRLRLKHSFKVQAKITFAPKRVSGRCVTLTAPCFTRGYAIRETDPLTVKTKEGK